MDTTNKEASASEKVKPELSILEQAEAIAQRIEAANKKSEEILQKNEATISRIMLSGRSNAVYETPAKREETPQEYAKRILAGKHEE